MQEPLDVEEDVTFARELIHKKNRDVYESIRSEVRLGWEGITDNGNPGEMLKQEVKNLQQQISTLEEQEDPKVHKNAYLKDFEAAQKFHRWIMEHQLPVDAPPEDNLEELVKFYRARITLKQYILSHWRALVTGSTPPPPPDDILANHTNQPASSLPPLPLATGLAISPTPDNTPASRTSSPVKYLFPPPHSSTELDSLNEEIDEDAKLYETAVKYNPKGAATVEQEWIDGLFAVADTITGEQVNRGMHLTDLRELVRNNQRHSHDHLCGIAWAQWDKIIAEGTLYYDQVVEINKAIKEVPKFSHLRVAAYAQDRSKARAFDSWLKETHISWPNVNDETFEDKAWFLGLRLQRKQHELATWTALAEGKTQPPTPPNLQNGFNIMDAPSKSSHLPSSSPPSSPQKPPSPFLPTSPPSLPSSPSHPLSPVKPPLVDYQSSDPATLFDNDDDVVNSDGHMKEDQDKSEDDGMDDEYIDEEMDGYAEVGAELDAGEAEHTREEVDEKKAGRFSEKFKVRLCSIQQEYEECVAQAAAEEGKNIHACWRFLDEHAETPRDITPFNAFQFWYADNGEFEWQEGGMCCTLSCLNCH